MRISIPLDTSPSTDISSSSCPDYRDIRVTSGSVEGSRKTAYLEHFHCAFLQICRIFLNFHLIYPRFTAKIDAPFARTAHSFTILSLSFTNASGACRNPEASYRVTVVDHDEKMPDQDLQCGDRRNTFNPPVSTPAAQHQASALPNLEASTCAAHSTQMPRWRGTFAGLGMNLWSLIITQMRT